MDFQFPPPMGLPPMGFPPPGPPPPAPKKKSNASLFLIAAVVICLVLLIAAVMKRSPVKDDETGGAGGGGTGGAGNTGGNTSNQPDTTSPDCVPPAETIKPWNNCTIWSSPPKSCSDPLGDATHKNDAYCQADFGPNWKSVGAVQSNCIAGFGRGLCAWSPAPSCKNPNFDPWSQAPPQTIVENTTRCAPWAQTTSDKAWCEKDIGPDWHWIGNTRGPCTPGFGVVKCEWKKPALPRGPNYFYLPNGERPKDDSGADCDYSSTKTTAAK